MLNKPRKRDEEVEQIKFITWLKKEGFEFVNHSPNGGKRGMLEAIRFKSMGTSSGFPDVEVPLPSGKYHGFYVEMKAQGTGKLSPNQIKWLDYLRGKGYFAECAHGFLEAKEMFLKYLSFTPKAA